MSFSCNIRLFIEIGSYACAISVAQTGMMCTLCCVLYSYRRKCWKKRFDVILEPDIPAQPLPLWNTCKLLWGSTSCQNCFIMLLLWLTLDLLRGFGGSMMVPAPHLWHQMHMRERTQNRLMNLAWWVCQKVFRFFISS